MRRWKFIYIKNVVLKWWDEGKLEGGSKQRDNLLTKNKMRNFFLKKKQGHCQNEKKKFLSQGEAKTCVAVLAFSNNLQQSETFLKRKRSSLQWDTGPAHVSAWIQVRRTSVFHMFVWEKLGGIYSGFVLVANASHFRYNQTTPVCQIGVPTETMTSSSCNSALRKH